MKVKKQMLFIYPRLTSFVKRDIEVYEKKYSISLFEFNPSYKWKTPFTFIHQFIYLLLFGWKPTIYLSYFGGYHSFLPSVFSRLYKKKHMIIVGGTDAVSFPSISYGNFNHPLITHFTKWSYHLSHVLVPVHETLAYCNYSYTADDYPAQGIQYHCQNLKTPVVPVNNGYRYHIWNNLNSERIPNSFLTVALTMGDAYFKRKGIDLILELARHFSNYSFAIVGVDKIEGLGEIPENVNLIPPVPFEELEQIYNSYQYYMQLSICEGLPNALCEAMLCGCVPIGSSAMSIPEIISSSGYLLKEKNISRAIELFHAIKEEEWENRSEKARMKIITDYPIEKRKTELIELSEKLETGIF